MRVFYSPTALLVMMLVVQMMMYSADALTKIERNKFRSTTNTFLNIASEVSATIDPSDNQVIILTSNGIPAHEAAGNGNRIIEAQNYRWKINRFPQQQDTATCLPLGPIGMAINGVPLYNPYSSGCCDAGAEELDLFDVCWGHPDGNNRYHYHVAPQCLYKHLCDKASGIVGVAFDGFPIYGPNDENGDLVDSGDLDECNGMTDSNGNYRYHLTTTFPYIVGCFKGEIDADFIGINRGCPCTQIQDPCIDLNGRRRRRKRDLADFICCNKRKPARCDYVKNE